MLTASLGSIPAYFAVLKFLGLEALTGWGLDILAALPGMLFALAAALFVVALRPVRSTAVNAGRKLTPFRRSKIDPPWS